jgi:gas vesicle protein
MHSANFVDPSRRSSRLPATVPILVTSLEPGADFSEVCETLVVSAHGCAIRSPMRLEAGIPVHFERKGGRETIAHVVDCQPMGSGQPGWMLAAQLDRPENFWGLKPCPQDWMQLPETVAQSQQQAPGNLPARNTAENRRGENLVVRSRKTTPEKIQHQLTDIDVRVIVADVIQSLQAEVIELKQKLGRGEPKRSQFDISLTHIPPEVEEKLWTRLRQDVGTQALLQARQQSEQVLEAAKDAIGKKIREAQNEFREQVAEELQGVEQRAQGLSADIAGAVQQHVDSGAERFQQHALEAGIRLERRSEEFLRDLQQRLSEENGVHRREMQKVQAEVASESSRLQAQTADLGSRITKLDESARQLESDLDNRLVRMGSDIISGARTQLQSAVDVVLKELSTRNAKELGNQLDEACERLKNAQKQIEASVSELVKTRVADSLLSFGQTMEELAQDSVERWRKALARDLNSVTNILGGQLRLEAASDSDENGEPPSE